MKPLLPLFLLLFFAFFIGCNAGGGGSSKCETDNDCPTGKQCIDEKCKSANCGNGQLDDNEACDGDQFGDETCTTQGFPGGSLLCTQSCQLDTSSCTDCEAPCDPDNCEQCTDGECISVCNPNETCFQGQCATDDCDPGCNLSLCEICQNGTCEITCSLDQICDDGLCMSEGCNPGCDPDSCESCQSGTCENICRLDEICEAGECVPTGCNPACDPNSCEICQDDTCVFFCAGDATCENGVCISGDCNPECDASECFYCQNDECVFVCSDETTCEDGLCVPIAQCDCDESLCEICVDDECISSCSSDEVCESGECINYNCDPQCDSSLCQVCRDGNCYSGCAVDEVCLDGECQSDCNPDCNINQCEVCDDGECIFQCGPDEICENGTCEPAGCVPDCDPDNCEECLDDECVSYCRLSEQCNNGTCEPAGCIPDCDSCETCINSTCVSECDPEETCQNGVCIIEGCRPECSSSRCEICEDGNCVTTCEDGTTCNGSGICETPEGCDNYDCSQHPYTHCEFRDDEPGCYCDEGYIVNIAGDACEELEDCTDDLVGNTFSEANRLLLPHDDTYTLCTYLPDYFKFSLAEDDVIIVVLDGFDFNEYDIDIKLYSPSDQEASIARSVGYEYEQIEYQVEESGDFYLAVTNWGQVSSDYHLAVNKCPEGNHLNTSGRCVVNTCDYLNCENDNQECLPNGGCNGRCAICADCSEGEHFDVNTENCTYDDCEYLECNLENAICLPDGGCNGQCAVCDGCDEGQHINSEGDCVYDTCSYLQCNIMNMNCNSHGGCNGRCATCNGCTSGNYVESENHCYPHGARWGSSCESDSDCPGTGTPGEDTFCFESGGGYCFQSDGPDFVAEGEPCAGDPLSVGAITLNVFWTREQCLGSCNTDNDCNPGYYCYDEAGQNNNIQACEYIGEELCPDMGCNDSGEMICTDSGCQIDVCDGNPCRNMANSTGTCTNDEGEMICVCDAEYRWNRVEQICEESVCDSTNLGTYSDTIVVTGQDNCSGNSFYSLPQGDSSCTGYTSGSNELVYRVTLPPGNYSVTMEERGFDASLWVTDLCDDWDGSSCIVGADDPEELILSNNTNNHVTYYIIADSFNNCGPFSLTIDEQ